VNVRSGEIKFGGIFPGGQNRREGMLPGLGRGVIAGREIFWPVLDKIYVLDVATGAPTRPAIDMTMARIEGANLAAAEGYIVAAGRERMMAWRAGGKE
jgi:hypothetical protein